MKKENNKLFGVDLFSGPGGLSLGFENAGFTILFAVESNFNSARTYKNNQSKGKRSVLISDIAKIDFSKVLNDRGLKQGDIDVLLCGLPCQGFSTSNRKTRTRDNPKNLLYNEFLRSVKEILPKWIVFENVSGIINFEKGEIIDVIISTLINLGYICEWQLLNSADFGVPQIRKRFFLVCNRYGIQSIFPLQKKNNHINVGQAFSDLPALENGNRKDLMPYKNEITELSNYQQILREDWDHNYCLNNGVTRNSEEIIERYKYIPQGGNWMDIPKTLMGNYTEINNCHSGIYKRLEWNKPSIVISNYRKNMLIHPIQNRGLSVREAARLQSFPDWYIFHGKLGSQQQQVADAVPPVLAEILGYNIFQHF